MYEVAADRAKQGQLLDTLLEGSWITIHAPLS